MDCCVRLSTSLSICPLQDVIDRFEVWIRRLLVEILSHSASVVEIAGWDQATDKVYILVLFELYKIIERTQCARLVLWIQTLEVFVLVL
jgi:hypothetical protein